VNSKDGDTTYLMSMDSYFKLIEYKEIVLARESATSARRYSLWAIGLAVTSLVVSIVFSFMQIHTPTTLNNAQLKELTTSAFDDTDVIANINTLSENQKLSNKLLMELKSKIVESKD